MSAMELVALCVSISTISTAAGGFIGRLITKARKEESFVTREELKREYPTREYVDSENKLLRMELRGLRSDMRLIQKHRPLPPLDEDDE